jgi:hypothetical protein
MNIVNADSENRFANMEVSDKRLRVDASRTIAGPGKSTATTAAGGVSPTSSQTFTLDSRGKEEGHFPTKIKMNGVNEYATKVYNNHTVFDKRRILRLRASARRI